MSKFLDEALLSAFIEASRTGTFGTAAKNLGRSQPLLTNQIQRLEDIVGYRLFSRTPRGAKLTPKGAQLLVYAQRIFAISEEALRLFATNGRMNNHPFRVRISEDLAGEILLRSLLSKTTFGRSFDLEIVSSGVAPTSSAFEEGEVDIFLGDLSPSLSETIGPMKTAAIQLVWAASVNFDPALRPLPLALYPQLCAWRSLVIETMDHALIDWVSAVESDSLSALQTAACTNIVMIACLPSSLARGLIAVDHKRYALPEPPKVEIAMYKSRSKRSAPELAELATVLWEFILGQNSQTSF